MDIDKLINRIEIAEGEWWEKQSPTMEESAQVWTPLGEVVLPQFKEISEHCDWSEVDRVLSIYEKTGKYALVFYTILKKHGHDRPEHMIDVIVRTKDAGKKVQSFFYDVTGVKLPWSNIYIYDPDKSWGSETVSDPVYANEEVEPLVSELFEPKAVEPKNDNARKKNLSLSPNMQYDVVAGNPPYQSSDERNKMWKPFVRRIYEVVKDGGYMSFIHPGSWKTYATPGQSSLLRDIFMKNNMLHLEVGTAEKYFSVGSSFDWYVMEKSDPTGHATVRTDGGEFEFNMTSLPCIPQHFTEISLKVTKKLIDEKPKLDIERIQTHHSHRDHVSEKKTEEFEYVLRNTKPNKNLRWASKKHPVQHEKKVLLTRSGKIRPEYDDGERGTTQSSLYILVDDEKEGNYIVSLLQSDLYTYFRRVNKQHGHHKHHFLREMPYVKGLDTENINEELYEHFGLDPDSDEVNEIEQYVK